MERPDRPVTTQPEEDWPSSAVALKRQQRRAKRIVERVALFVMVGPVCLGSPTGQCRRSMLSTKGGFWPSAYGCKAGGRLASFI